MSIELTILTCRLIANCIIFYNASILSRLLEHQERTGDTQGAEATKKIAPIAWQHLNLQGRYEFQKAPDALNVDAIIRTARADEVRRMIQLEPEPRNRALLALIYGTGLRVSEASELR